MRKATKQPEVKLPLDPNAGTPAEVWNDYFSKRKLNPADISKVVLQLHAAGQHEHVIAAIEAALIHGQAQPWMYETLALSMQIAGRPQDEIERVLLSRIERGPKRDPGRFVVAMSNGTPSMAKSTPSRDRL